MEKDGEANWSALSRLRITIRADLSELSARRRKAKTNPVPERCWMQLASGRVLDIDTSTGACGRHTSFHFVGDTSTVHRYGRGATSRCASARCVLQGFVSETE
eukprot:1308252-Pleurochrysis_carterae.AAC.2